jgi:hypothetical protein
MMANSITSVTCNQFNRDVIIKKLCDENHSSPFYLIKDNVIVWDFSLRSQSSEWIADTIEYGVSFLLNKGVTSDNIYTFCEWTSWDRISVDLYDWLDIKKEDLDIQTIDNNFGMSFPVHLKPDEIFPSSEYSKELTKLHEEINIGTSNGNVGRIGDRFYLTPTHTQEEDFESVKAQQWHRFAKEYELKIPTEVKISNYLNNIIRTQNFLKKNSIKYNFVFMQQSLSGWIRGGDNMDTLYDFLNNPSYKLQFIQDDEIVTNINFKPVADKSTNIEEIYTPAKLKMNQIDFDNIWFYKNEKYERGGIDEWAIDNFGLGCMLNEYIVEKILKKEYDINNPFNEISRSEVITSFGYHPNTELYKLIWNKAAFNCSFFKIDSLYKERLEEMLYEDLNHTGVSKNCILISKKELDRLSPKKINPMGKILI